MALYEKRKGEWFLFSGTFLIAFLTVVTALSFANLPPLISLGWSTAFAALFLGLFVIYKCVWHELWNLLLWKYVFFASFFISVLMYGLFFLGLEKTTPGNAAIISLLEVLTSFLFFNVIRGERISLDYKVGAFLMAAGAFIIVARDFSSFNVGDLFIVAATFCAPVGNLFQQKAREIASGETTIFLRSIFAVPIIFLFAYAFNENASMVNITSALPLLCINGAILLGFSRILWVEAIHRISVTKAQALASSAPFLTLLFAWVLLNQVPSIWQMASLVPLLIGTLLLTDHVKLSAWRR